MNEKLEAPGFSGATLCGWCGIPLGSANLVQQSVCVRCYELLTKANLSNEEIFADENRKRSSSSLYFNGEGRE